MAGRHLLFLNPAPDDTALAESLTAAGFELAQISDLSEIPDGIHPDAIVLAICKDRPSPAEIAALRGVGGPLVAVCQADLHDRNEALAALGVDDVLAAGPEVPAAITQVIESGDRGLREDERAGRLGPGILAHLIMEIGTRDAILSCASAWDNLGTVWLRDGLVVDAQLGVLAPVRAFERIFTFESGGYYARVASHNHEDALLIDAQEAVAEGMARAAIWRRCVRDLGGRRRVYRVDSDVLASAHDLPDQSDRLVKLIDGERTLVQIIDLAQYDELHTLPVLQRLHTAGVLVPVGLPEAPEDDFEDLIEAELIEAAPPAPEHIRVVRFEPLRGNRLIELERRGTQARLHASERNEVPLLLTDMVVPPGGVKIPPRAAEQTEILVSSPVPLMSPAPPPSRSLPLALMLVVGALAVVAAFAGVPRHSDTPTDDPEPAVAPPPSPAPAPEKPVVAGGPPATEVLPKAGEPPASTDLKLSTAEKPKAIPAIAPPPAATPKTAAAFVTLGKSLYEANKLDRAIEALEHATKLDPKAAAAYLYLGTVLQDAHRTEEAKNAYRSFLGLEPPDSPRHHEIESVLKALLMANTRDLILSAARKLIREKGLSETTTRMIAREAGCADGAVFYHFKNRIELFNEMLMSNVPALLKGLTQLPLRVGAGTVEGNLVDALVAMYAFHAEIIPLLSALMAEPKLLAEYRNGLIESQRGPQVMGEHVEAYLKAEQRLKRVDPRANVAVFTQLMISSSVQHAHISAFFDRPERSPRTWARPIIRALLSGMAGVDTERPLK